MIPRFLYSARYKWKLPPGCPDTSEHGALIEASGLTKHALVRRRFDSSAYLANRIFDPQLYLAQLDATSVAEAALLATEPPP